MCWETSFIMNKKNLLLLIEIRMVTTMYIVRALLGTLSGVLFGVLYGALLGNCRAPLRSPKERSICMPFLNNKTISARHKKEGFMNHIENNKGRRIGLYLHFWPGSSAHLERRRSDEKR